MPDIGGNVLNEANVGHYNFRSMVCKVFGTNSPPRLIDIEKRNAATPGCGVTPDKKSVGKLRSNSHNLIAKK